MRRAFLVCLLAGLLAAGATPADASMRQARGGGSPIPAQAKAAGYSVNTFHTEAFTSSNVDTGATSASGFKWYGTNFFGASQAASIAAATLNPDGTTTVTQGGTSPSALSSAAYVAGPAPNFVGAAFGGGAYFEAQIKFNPVGAKGTQWPAWWLIAIEHSAQFPYGDTWPGQASGYEHYIEPDIFEYSLGGNPQNYYAGTLHEWYGLFNSTCSPGHCDSPSPSTLSAQRVPVGTDWTIYHRLGLLWVPATSSSLGYIAYYFDDVLMQTFTWSQYCAAQAPPAPAYDGTSCTLGIFDTQHFILQLGSSFASPMTVKSVDVWQAGTASNLVY